MVSLGLAALALLSLLFLALRRSRAMAGALVLLAGGFLLFGLGFATRPMLAWLQDPVAAHDAASDPGPWCQRNTLILLGAGTLEAPSGAIEPTLFGFARNEAAARAHHACAASGGECAILVSGGDPAGLGESEAEVYAHHLRGLGVPEASLILEGESRNTFENARFTRRLLEERLPEGREPGGLFLVTSATHMVRSDLYFRHFGMAARWLPADFVQARTWPPKVGLNLALADLAAHEFAGLLRYRTYNALGLNPPPIPAPARGACPGRSGGG